MPRASKNKVSKDIKREIEEALFWFLSKELKNSKSARYFLEEFLTKEERMMLGKRLFVGYLVRSGLTLRGISSILKVSINTVLRGSSRLEKQAGYREIIEKLVKRENSKEFDKKIQKILRRVFPITKSDWSKFSGRSGDPS